MLVDVHHAQKNLDTLLDRMLAGEDIVIAREGRPMVRLVPVVAQGSGGKVRLGGLKLAELGLSADFHAATTDDELIGRGNSSGVPSRQNTKTSKRKAQTNRVKP